MTNQKTFISVPIIIHFGDTDPYGVVYFASYFKYCHHGIEAFFKTLGLPPHRYFRNTDKGFGLPVVDASCKFTRPVWYGEELELRVLINSLKEKSITFGFQFYRAGTSEQVAEGEATIVAIGRDWRARSLPNDLREAVEQFLRSGDCPRRAS